MHFQQISFTHKWIFMWAAIFLLAVLVQPAESNDNVINPPSRSFWNTHMRLCDVDDNNKCHTSTYARSVARFAVGGLLVAFLAFVAFILFVPVRFICNGCGGQNHSYGVCPDLQAKRQYTRNEIVSTKVATFILLIPIVIAVGLGFQSNSDISSSVHTVTRQIVISGDDIVNTITEVRDILISFNNYTADIQVVVNDAVKAANSVDKNLHDAHDTANRYDNVRKSLMEAGFICCIALVGVGIVCAVFNLRVLSLVLGIISMVILIIVWLSFGVHFVADKFVYDVCNDIDILSANTTSNATSVFKTGALAKLWKCDNNTDLYHLLDLVSQSIEFTAESACSLRSSICFNPETGQGDPNWTCDLTTPCNRDTFTTETDATHMRVMDGTTSRSLADCAVNCTNAAYRNASYQIVSGVENYNNYTDIYYNKVVPIVTCQEAIDILVELRDPLCNNMFDSLYGVAISSLILGIFYIPFSVLMVVGFKRFQSLSGGIV